MTDLIDIYRAAKLVIDETAKTLSFTRLRGRWFSLAKVTNRGAAIWRQITAAVEELQRERRPGEPVN
jgi:hypothetical protein